MLPVNFLKQLIGLYGNSMQNFVPQYLEAAMDAFKRNQSALARCIQRQHVRRSRQAQHGDVRGRQPGIQRRCQESGKRIEPGAGRAARRTCEAAGKSRSPDQMKNLIFALAAASVLPFFSVASAQVPAAVDLDRRAGQRSAGRTADRGGSWIGCIAGDRSAVRRRSARSRGDDAAVASRPDVTSRRRDARHLTIWTSTVSRSVPARFLPTKDLDRRSERKRLRCSTRSRSAADAWRRLTRRRQWSVPAWPELDARDRGLPS